MVEGKVGTYVLYGSAVLLGLICREAIDKYEKHKANQDKQKPRPAPVPSQESPSLVAVDP
ncbi:hypothetical protein DCAR_0103561 [Daucus carota subsp. sativus]|uniref:Uncharacterized protein n=1 Tax=Daucus carota subsp. sativus TaxID=79200 RepID=A0A166I3D5_DAUCS|nr:hypothetical protein DCAR_0103561 [Daucus carota subsp. sativus]